MLKYFTLVSKRAIQTLSIRFYAKKSTNSLRGYQPVIGLEVHAQILSKSKLFSGSSTKFAGSPNTQVSLVDAAFPGTLPVINKFCVEQAIKTGIALHGKIHKKSQFDRKHYFYADLPAGYQITQHFYPIMTDGRLTVELPNGESKVVRIERLQIEQDSGKSLHDQDPNSTLIDLNRAGIGLMEIVSYPDIRSSQEAEYYLKTLQHLLKHIGTCSGNMEEGSMRCDINVSIHKPGQPFGTRCEVKNVSGIVGAVKAIEYEINRQIELVESGKEVEQETRVFDAHSGKTILLRTKENAPDYRYLPEPDLPPLILDPQYIEEIRASLPELPDQIKERFIRDYGLSKYDTSVLLMAGACPYFETVAKGRNPKKVTNWITSELFGLLNKENKSITESPVTEKQLGGLIDLVEEGTISGRTGKDILELMYFGDKREAIDIVKSQGLEQISDSKAIEEMCEKVIHENPDELKRYLAGKENLFKFFVGQVIKQTKGKANPQLVNRIMKETLMNKK